MSRQLKVRKPNATEMRQLRQMLEESTNARLCRWAEALLFYGAGLDAQLIADALSVHVNTIYTCLHRFARAGTAFLKHLPSQGAPLRITAAQVDEIARIAEQSPTEFGLPYGRWSLAKLQDYVIHQRRLLKAISREHLRRVLRKKNIHLRHVQRKLISHDPRRRAILARIRAVWRRLPRNGAMLFFDIKPIAVKAYGGRRYTSAKRLVLERHQKTRGFFYLFALYDVKQGRVRWAFYSSKDAEHICRFMRCVRRWYPQNEVWVILDQDRTHPRKCRETRRTMRELKLHWISLPKASPDDNAVEILFSDVQLMILDNSNDPDPQTTQRRISAHWRQRNRRRDRFITIPYLW